MKSSLLLVYILAGIAFALETIGLTVYGFMDEFLLPIFLADSLLILVAAFIIRFQIIDAAKLDAIIIDSDNLSNDPVATKPLTPSRFYNYMPVAMVFNFIAGPVIHYSPAAGALVFLVAHIFHIRAFSGLIHLKPRLLFTGAHRAIAIAATIFWSAAAAIVYPAFVLLSTTDLPRLGEVTPEFKLLLSIVLLPYVLILAFTTLLTYIALGYKQRPLRFRLMLTTGMTFFLFSDTMIGYSIFIDMSKVTVFLIYPTYLVALFLMQYTILALDRGEGSGIRSQ